MSSTSTTAAGPGLTRRRMRARQTRAALAFMAPFFVLFTLITVVPIVYAIYLSVFQDRASGLGFGGKPKQVFVGLSNFTDLLTDHTFLMGFVHVFLYGVLSVGLILVLAASCALMIDSAYAKAKRSLQFAMFIPHLIPGVIAAILWLFLYSPHISPVVQFLAHLGWSINPLGTGGTYATLINLAIWEGLGYNIIVYFASLQAIPSEIIEAARMDGAGEFRLAWSVKLPMIRSAVAVTALFATIGSVQLLSEPLFLSQAGGAVSSVWTPSLYAYDQAFNQHNFGMAAAASLLLAVVAGALSYAVSRIARPWESDA